jgi:hypothetical protein
MRAPLMFLPNPGIISSTSPAPTRRNVRPDAPVARALHDEQREHEAPIEPGSTSIAAARTCRRSEIIT